MSANPKMMEGMGPEFKLIINGQPTTGAMFFGRHQPGDRLCFMPGLPVG
jgi:hypothetical protein